MALEQSRSRTHDSNTHWPLHTPTPTLWMRWQDWEQRTVGFAITIRRERIVAVHWSQTRGSDRVDQVAVEQPLVDDWARQVGSINEASFDRYIAMFVKGALLFRVKSYVYSSINNLKCHLRFELKMKENKLPVAWRLEKKNNTANKSSLHKR